MAMSIDLKLFHKLSFEALDDLPEAVFWFDEDANFIQVNKKACKDWGYTREEFLSMTIFDVNPNMNPDNWSPHWQKKIHDPSSFESSHIRKDGTEFPVDITDNFVSHNGKIYCCAIIRDISERKQKDKIARLADFTIQGNSDAIFWIDKHGGILHSNHEARERYGYSEEELTGLNVLDISRDMSSEGFTDIWERIREEKSVLIEGNHYTKEGKRIDVEINTNYVQFENEEYTASIVRDITVRKRKEGALRGALMEIRELKEKLEVENNYLNEEIEIKNNFGEIITDNDEFKKILNKVEQVANTSSTVLITGESGTGKELLVRAIHQLSVRSERPVIKLNCGSLPSTVIESELFGHDKGAFIGAVSKKIGKFELANEGTLFLDEVSEIPLEVQSKLMRVIQEGEFERLGGTTRIKVNVRIIATSNKDLVKEIEQGRFREDLYYRLNVFPIQTLPLRKRKDDIPILTRYFCDKLGNKIGKTITDIPESVINKLMSYDFPGNVRELQNLIERGVITSKRGKLRLADFNPKQRRKKPEDFISLVDMQRQYIAKVLEHTNWRVSGEKGASVILGLRPTTLFSKIEKLGIKRSTKAEY